MTISEIIEVVDNPEGASIKLTPEELYARRTRSVAIALGAFVLVIFAVTIARLGSGALAGPDYMRPLETIGRI